MHDPCFPINDAPFAVAEARRRILAALRPIDGSERLPLTAAYGRVLADDAHSPMDLPPERNAAMDGYAFNHQDLREQGFALPLAGVSWAGNPYSRPLSAGHCLRVYTGAVLPDGADCVVMQEQVEMDGTLVRFPAGLQAFQHVRQAGEDVARGDLLLAAPRRLGGVELALLAAAGIATVPVKPRVDVAYFSNGDELRPVGEPLVSGQIFDSNRYLLHGLLQDPAYAVTDLGVCGDDRAALKDLLGIAAQRHRVLLSSGGASVGDADHMHSLLSELGEVSVWKIAIKPGKPLMFGKIGACHFFGLPGNPVSALVTFQQFVAPALRQLSGIDPVPPLRIRARCLNAIKKGGGREEYQRGFYQISANGEFCVSTAIAQGSHQLAATCKANCYVVLPADCGSVAANDWVDIEPFPNYGW